MRLSTGEALRRAAAADHGILGTARAGEGPDLVPVVFVIDGERLAIPIDRVKPKESLDLQRVRNLEADPRATLLVEGWDPADWSRLWWVRLRLEASTEPAATTERLGDLLRERYPPYRGVPFAAMLVFRIVEITGWAAAAESHGT